MGDFILGVALDNKVGRVACKTKLKTSRSVPESISGFPKPLVVLERHPHLSSDDFIRVEILQCGTEISNQNLEGETRL
jgi:hypothetical protein